MELVRLPEAGLSVCSRLVFSVVMETTGSLLRTTNGVLTHPESTERSDQSRGGSGQDKNQLEEPQTT